MKRNHRARKERMQPKAIQRSPDLPEEVKAVLESKYDPAIMDELLSLPEMREIVEAKNFNSFEMEILKGSLVLFGYYESYLHVRKGQNEITEAGKL